MSLADRQAENGFMKRSVFLVRRKWLIAAIICICIGVIVIAAILLLRPHLNTYVDAWFV